jgi:hypothetical protein
MYTFNVVYSFSICTCTSVPASAVIVYNDDGLLGPTVLLRKLSDLLYIVAACLLVLVLQ